MTAEPTPAPTDAGAPAPAPDLHVQIDANRERLLGLDRGSPEYQEALAERERLFGALAGEASAPAETLTVTPDDDARAAAEAASAYTLPEGVTWRPEAVAELRGSVRNALGAEAVDGLVLGGMHAARSALLEIQAGARPSAQTTERVLRAEWGAAYDDEIDAASEAWEALPKHVQADLTRTGVRWHPDFVRFMAEAGAKLYAAKPERRLRRYAED